MTKWIYTDGAPFICADPATRKQWRGIQGSSTGRDESDYERACNEPAYLGWIACSPSQVLVLGDEPAQAAFLVTPSGPAIARWIACESMRLADSVLAKIPSDLPHLQPAVRFTVSHPELWMFDASADGTVDTSISAAVNIEPGVFNVTTERLQNGRSFDFLIHRFVLTSLSAD